MRKMIFRGLVNGLRTTWDLAIIIVPVYLLVFLLQQTAILSRIGTACRPLMAMMGLPGEAAMGVVLGNLLNLYAAIGAVSPLALETSQITVFALLLLISHSLVVETAVSRKVGIVAWPYVVLRLGVGFIVAVILHRCWLAG
ncbi:MAG: nucleoside recognition protein [Deltaproteobacteria bacterium]|nr:nucleoside recognition protein [Candidatus Anaeroferrophillus wilburensis]MBN2888692.1 nucleoside recognition protein [Deltaproteobacteria bacterium]